MKHLRISTTTIDSYRYCQSSEYFSEDDLIKQLKGDFSPNPRMLFGIGYHRLIEKGVEEKGHIIVDERNQGVLKTRKYRLNDDLMQPALFFRDQHPDMTHEIKSTARVQIDDYIIDIVGKVDALEGLTAYEHKTSSHAPYEKYLNSYQWRLYCLIFGVEQVVYNIFELKGAKEDLEEADAFHGVRGFIDTIDDIKLKQYYFYSYDTLEQDCYQMINNFLFFIKSRKLEDLFLTNP